jgi:catechol 2,3-dioxygenase-like lactoylglutathione lyase family enzyme
MTDNSPTAGAVYSHVTVGTDDMARATAFYDTLLAPLGLERIKTFKIAIGYAPKDFAGVNAPFWVLRPRDRKAASAGNGVTVAFTVDTRRAVDAFHAAALASGGLDEGAPGIRGHYHENYYGAYIRDPDGNKICAVCHMPPID